MTPDRVVVPFRRWHYDWLDPSAVDGPRLAVPEESLERLEDGRSWTGVVNGVPIVCAGVIQHWRGRSEAWAFMSHRTGPHMLWITREVKKKLDEVQGRIEITVRHDFVAGQRWAALLGFKIEGWLERYGPEGESHISYVRFN